MKLLSLILFCFIVSGCLNEGTDTGNPGIIERAPSNDLVDVSGLVSKLATNLCSLLEQCDSINQCDSRVLQQTNIDVKLGLDPDEFANLNEIAGAVSVGILVEDPAVATDCFADIEVLTCSSPNVGDAYDDMKANPLEGVANIVPVSCLGLVR